MGKAERDEALNADLERRRERDSNVYCGHGVAMTVGCRDCVVEDEARYGK